MSSFIHPHVSPSVLWNTAYNESQWGPMFPSKYLLLGSFEKIWLRVNNDTTLIFGWTIPLRHSRLCYMVISLIALTSAKNLNFLHPQNYRGAVHVCWSKLTYLRAFIGLAVLLESCKIALRLCVEFSDSSHNEVYFQNECLEKGLASLFCIWRHRKHWELYIKCRFLIVPKTPLIWRLWTMFVSVLMSHRFQPCFCCSE